MWDILSIDRTFFTVLDYPMSYVEFVGTVLYLWSVWLIAQRHILTWPVGIVSVLLYMALFYQIRLYSDAFEQVYYLGACVYGWWIWSHSPRRDFILTDVAFSSRREIVLALAVTAALALATATFMTRIHVLLPRWFSEEAAFPYLDAATTLMSFTAMWLMARKRIESWLYWIVVDVIGIGLYYAKNVRFVALLYIILLVLAMRGLYLWLRATRAQGAEVA